jgi:hypothetical protein
MTTLTIFAFIVTVAVTAGVGFRALRGRSDAWLDQLEASRVPVTQSEPRRPTR